MKTTRLIGLVLLTCMLAACHRGQDISFEGHSVSLHASGQPTATITSRGSFSVGSKLIDVTPAQRQLFLRYYNRVTSIHADTQALKQAGWDMAGSALHMAGESIKDAVAGGASTDNNAAGQAMGAKGKQMGQRAAQLCHSVQQAQTLQATLAQQVPAFKPYANIDAASGVRCGHDVTVG